MRVRDELRPLGLVPCFAARDMTAARERRLSSLREDGSVCIVVVAKWLQRRGLEGTLTQVGVAPLSGQVIGPFVARHSCGPFIEENVCHAFPGGLSGLQLLCSIQNRRCTGQTNVRGGACLLAMVTTNHHTTIPVAAQCISRSHVSTHHGSLLSAGTRATTYTRKRVSSIQPPP